MYNLHEGMNTKWYCTVIFMYAMGLGRSGIFLKLKFLLTEHSRNDLLSLNTILNVSYLSLIFLSIFFSLSLSILKIKQKWEKIQLAVPQRNLTLAIS